MSVKPAAGIRFPVTVPVLVIGAGAGGLTAALAAHDAGAEVLATAAMPPSPGNSAPSNPLSAS
jgi:fumarate reductase flavoprotein subunit